MNTNVAKCLVVSKVLVADGMVGDSERAFLDGVIRSLGLTDAERQSVIDLEGLDEADGIVAQLPLEERRELLALLVDAAGSDGTLSPYELRMVKKITVALGL